MGKSKSKYIQTQDGIPVFANLKAVNFPPIKAVSYDELANLARHAFEESFTSTEGMEYAPYVVAVYPEFVICCKAAAEYYRVDYTVTDGMYVFANPADWQRVEQDWIDSNLKWASDPQIYHVSQEVAYYGDSVKALGGGKVAGLLVRYGSPDDTDAEGEYFTKATDFDFEDGDPVTIYYHHGLDPVLKRRKLGKATMRRDDVGIWVEGQLNLRDEYEKQIYAMAEKGKLGWSSGTAGHLVDRMPSGKSVMITAWPLGKDASLTPTPAEIRNAAIPVKSLSVITLASLAETAKASAATATPANTANDEWNQAALKARATLLVTED